MLLQLFVINWYLCAEEQVPQLDKGEEDDEEHDREPGQVLGSLEQAGRIENQ